LLLLLLHERRSVEPIALMKKNNVTDDDISAR
jgi:hypothetical protein